MPAAPLFLRLAARELRTGARGLVLFVASLALGVTAIAGVGSLSHAFVRGLELESRRILGGDVEVSVVHGALPPSARAVLQAAGEVSEVADAQVMAFSEAGEARTVVQMKGVDAAYPLSGAVGLSPDGPITDVFGPNGRGAAADAALLERLGLSLGDAIRVGAASFEIRAVLTDEPDRAAAGFLLGPRLLVSLGGAEATGLLQPGSLVDRAYRVRLSAADDEAAEAFRTRFRTAFPDAPWRVRTAREASGALSAFLERLLMFLTLAGLAALVVGGVGVADAVRAYMRRKTEAIATLKALGASSQLIFSVYLTACLAMALVAAAIGVALGAAAPYAAVWALGDRLPFPAALGVYPAPLLEAAAFGLVVAAAFALRPLATARETPAAQLFRSVVGAPPRPRPIFAAAIAGLVAAFIVMVAGLAEDPAFALWFTAGVFSIYAVLLLAALGLAAALRLAPAPRRPALRLAHANLVGPGSHAASVTVSLGLGLALFGAMALIDANLNRQVSQVFPSSAPSLWFADIGPDQTAAFDAVIAETPATNYHRHPMLRAGIVALNGVAVEERPGAQASGWVREGDWGVSYARRLPEGDEILAGEAWPEDYAGPPILSLDADQADLLGVKVGDAMTLAISGRTLEARIANLREVDWTAGGLNFVAVFAPGALEAARPTHVGGVRAASLDEEEAIFRRVSAAFPNVTVIRTREAIQAVTRVLDEIALAVRAMTAIVIGAGVLVLIGAIAATFRTRLYDAMVMKAMGASRAHLIGAYAVEYALLGAAPALLGVGLAYALAYAVVTLRMEMAWSAPIGLAAATVAGSAALVLGVGLIGMWRVIGGRPWPVLRQP